MALYQPSLSLSDRVHILLNPRQDTGTQRSRSLPLGLVERPGVERIDQREHQTRGGRCFSFALPYPPLNLRHRQVVVTGDRGHGRFRLLGAD